MIPPPIPLTKEHCNTFYEACSVSFLFQDELQKSFPNPSRNIQRNASRNPSFRQRKLWPFSFKPMQRDLFQPSAVALCPWNSQKNPSCLSFTYSPLNAQRPNPSLCLFLSFFLPINPNQPTNQSTFFPFSKNTHKSVSLYSTILVFIQNYVVRIVFATPQIFFVLEYELHGQMVLEMARQTIMKGAGKMDEVSGVSIL